jgi:hypothetical protein
MAGPSPAMTMERGETQQLPPLFLVIAFKVACRAGVMMAE